MPSDEYRGRGAAEASAADHVAFETPTARIGREGLQLNKSLDDLTMQEVSRLSNLVHSGGDLYTRFGQTQLAGMGGTVHAIRRLNDPKAGTFTRFWGAGTNWYRGASGGLAVLTGGFSGDPITHLTVRPLLSGESWMVAADRLLMQKATAASPISLPLGLPAPAGLTTVIGGDSFNNVVNFDATDGTQAANWTAFNGFPLGTPATIVNPAVGLVPAVLLPFTTKADVAGTSGNAVEVTTAIQASGITTTINTLLQDWIAGIGIAKPMDLTFFTATATPITDDDVVHVSLRVSFPGNFTEIRIYFVCSPFTLPASPVATAWSLPGMGIGNFSPSAYLLTIRPSDYTNALLALETMQSAADRVRTAAFLESFSDPVIATLAGAPSTEGGTAGVWTQFSSIGLPVIRRGDLVKIGTAGQPGTDWSTITGIYAVAQVIAGTPIPNVAGKFALDDITFRGGFGPDTGEPGDQKYDYRVVNVDPRTGARSNGTPIQTGAPGALDANGVILPASANIPDLTLDALRMPITIVPTAYVPDPLIRQEAFRRGGSLNDNWRFVGRNATNGGGITDILADLDIANADTVPLDHFQPVATVNAAGVVVLAQPLPILFGPFDDGTVCGLGDPYQPGFLYACLPGEIDHWPSTGGYAIEVCSPAEELMNGCIHGGQGFVLSRERGYTVYTNISGGQGVVATPSGCRPGLAARWGFTQGPGGIYYVARDGIRVTTGGDSQILSDQIRPLFHNQTVNGIAPIDFAVPTAIRLAHVDTDLHFLFQDTTGARQCFVFSLLYRYWRTYAFGRVVSVVYEDETAGDQNVEGALLTILGSTDGNAYSYSGFTDSGTPIPFAVRTGAWHWGHPREEKHLGDLVLEADLQGITLTAQTLLDTETITNASQPIVGSVGRARYIVDPFGATPQHARNVSIDLSGTAPTTARAFLSFLGIGQFVDPEVTQNRAVAWTPLGPTEGYLYACCLDCDTSGVARTILVEYDLAGSIGVAATLTVTANGRHKLWFSWPEVHAQLVRLRPTDGAPWLLYNVDWRSDPEPARIAGWDTNREDLGDSYYTGMDLELDTFGQDKTLHVTVDEVEIPGSPFTVNRNGHLHQHLTFNPPGRGHVYRAYATDGNPGLLYAHKWIVEVEPLEQTNWNAPYTVWNSLSDKYLKGVILEADTYGQNKAVEVQVDQTTLVTLTVNHTGRSVKNYTWPQVLGRVFRIIPTDNFPSRLYTAQPLFDEEPFALSRWEGQLYDFDFPISGWGSLLSMDCCYKAMDPVVLTFDIYDSQGRLLQTITGIDYNTGVALLPSTGGAKQKRFVVFPANKGVLYKPLAVSTNCTGITIYKEESRMRLQPWSGGGVLLKWLTANDDLMATREMTKAAVAAGRQGGAMR
jgi:hypothetical protein